MGMERVPALGAGADPDTKPEIVLKPSELWEYHKNRLEWLRKQRDGLVRACQLAAERAVRHRVREREASSGNGSDSEDPGDPWDELDAKERARLCGSILTQLVERSGASAEFVLKLLPKPVEAFVEDAVETLRQSAEDSGANDELEPVEAESVDEVEMHRSTGTNEESTEDSPDAGSWDEPGADPSRAS
jgi:hypothetical protein